MGQGNAGGGGTAQRRGDAGDDRYGETGGTQGFDLLAAAPEDEGIARLQPHHGLAGPHAAHQLGFDVGLRPARLALALADRTPARRRGARGRGWPAGTSSSCRMASASCRSCAARRVSRSGSPGPAPTMWAMPTGDRRRRTASSSPSATRRAPASSPASTSRAAGPSTSRRQKPRRRAGSGIRALAWARKVLASLRQRTDPLGQRRLDATAQDAGQGGRGAAGRDRDHDAVAIDDGGQDEIAERRPVGDVHRHAGGLGDALHGGVALERAGRDEGRGGASEIGRRGTSRPAASRRRRPSARARRGGRRQAPRPPRRPCGR